MDERIKIVAICGSPHKGNTFDILNTLAQSELHVELKILMLSDYNLTDCVGCYSCVLTGEENCPHTDDRDRILLEMINADGVIFASPTYARTISALMKKFVERTSYVAHRPMFFGKYALSLSTCGGFGADLTCKYMKEHFTQYGFMFVSSVELKTSTKSEIEKSANRTKAIQAYRRLIQSIKEKEVFQPTFGQLVYFNIFRSISILNKDKGWADYDFYRDKEDFYIDVQIPFIKNALAKLVAKREVRKMITTK